jgi:nickel transport protein
MKKYFACVLCVCGLLLAGPAWAHKVSVYAYVEGGQIKGEGYFAGGDKAKGCDIEVSDAKGQAVAQAKTDERGQFSLPLPQAAPPLKIVLHAGQGHQGDYSLTAADLGQGQGLGQDQGQPAGEAAFPPRPAGTPAAAPVAAAPAVQAAPAAPALDAAALEQIVAQAVAQAVDQKLEQRLAPLTAQVAKLAGERAISLQDVIGGLGYILGLMGIAAYVKSRQGAGPPRS